MDAAKQQAVNLIKDNKVMVFSKIGCPYCDHTKRLFNDLIGSTAYHVYTIQGMSVR